MHAGPSSLGAAVQDAVLPLHILERMCQVPKTLLPPYLIRSKTHSRRFGPEKRARNAQTGRQFGKKQYGGSRVYWNLLVGIGGLW